MNCPRCDHQTLKVLESRAAEGGDAIRRRRECLECNFRFTSYERVERQPLIVVKDDGREQAFDREKLLYGLVRACSKRDVPTERLEALVIDIETQLRARNLRAVSSRDIGGLALQGLLRVDEVAYIRFASVYRQFGDLEEFSRELRRIKRSRAAAVALAAAGTGNTPDRDPATDRGRRAPAVAAGSR